MTEIETGYRELYILIEGDDDERFVKAVITPKIQDNYDYIGYYKYAQKPKNKVERFIHSLISKHADYFCLADYDVSSCIMEKKQQVKRLKLGDINDDKIFVVRQEIESWYLAGVSDSSCKRLRIPIHPNTNEIAKEQLEHMIESSNFEHIDCLIEMLKKFDVNIAKVKNSSFGYFYNKRLLQ